MSNAVVDGCFRACKDGGICTNTESRGEKMEVKCTCVLLSWIGLNCFFLRSMLLLPKQLPVPANPGKKIQHCWKLLACLQPSYMQFCKMKISIQKINKQTKKIPLLSVKPVRECVWQNGFARNQPSLPKAQLCGRQVWTPPLENTRAMNWGWLSLQHKDPLWIHWIPWLSQCKTNLLSFKEFLEKFTHARRWRRKVEEGGWRPKARACDASLFVSACRRENPFGQRRSRREHDTNFKATHCV